MKWEVFSCSRFPTNMQIPRRGLRKTKLSLITKLELVSLRDQKRSLCVCVCVWRGGVGVCVSVCVCSCMSGRRRRENYLLSDTFCLSSNMLGSSFMAPSSLNTEVPRQRRDQPSLLNKELKRKCLVIVLPEFTPQRLHGIPAQFS